MILYHGGTDIVQAPKIITAENGRDFGFAFCTNRALSYITFSECQKVG